MANITKELLTAVKKQKDITVSFVIESDTAKRKGNEISGIDYLNSYINALNGVDVNSIDKSEYNKRLAKVLTAYNHLKTRKHVKDDSLLEGLKLDEREEMLSNVETILKGCGINNKQLETFNKYISNIDDVEEIDENGEEKLTDAAKERIAAENLEKQKKLEEKQTLADKKILAQEKEENDLNKLKEIARKKADKRYKEKVDSIIKEYKDAYSDPNSDCKNNVIFDADFIQRKVNIRTELFGLKKNEEGYEEEYTSYERVKKTREDCDRMANESNLETRQNYVAERRTQTYVSLRYQIENRTFLEIIKAPWKALMDTIEYSRMKKSMKESYKLTDEALDKLYQFGQDKLAAGMTYQVPEDLGILQPDGTIIKCKAPEKVVNAQYEKLKENYYKSKEATDNVAKDTELINRLAKDVELNDERELEMGNSSEVALSSEINPNSITINNNKSKDSNKSQSNIQPSGLK